MIGYWHDTVICLTDGVECVLWHWGSV